jgi:hypothetical protein
MKLDFRFPEMKPKYALAIFLFGFSFLAGCGKDNQSPQLGTTTPEASAQQATQFETGDFDKQAHQKAIDEAMAASEKAYEARAHGAPLPPSQFNFPNPPGERPIPNYRNFYSINDHYQTYLLCEYQVDERNYNPADEPKWFKSALKQIRESGPARFPPLQWMAVIIFNIGEYKDVNTFEECHKVGVLFKASDVFDSSRDISQPTPGDQQRWLIVERHAATNSPTAASN